MESVLLGVFKGAKTSKMGSRHSKKGHAPDFLAQQIGAKSFSAVKVPLVFLIYFNDLAFKQACYSCS